MNYYHTICSLINSLFGDFVKIHCTGYETISFIKRDSSVLPDHHL